MRLIFLAILLAPALLLATPVHAAPCDSLPTTLRVGQTVEVISQVNARSAPGFNGRVVTGLRTGDRLTLVDEAACVNALTWWPVTGAAQGWVAEATQGVTYLRAVETEAAPFDGQLTYDLAPGDPAEESGRCPPLIGEVTVNYADVDLTQSADASTVFFVDSGFAVPLPALCFPSAQLSSLTLTGPDGSPRTAIVTEAATTPDYVQATLPPFAILHNGSWTLSIEGHSLSVDVIGPFGPLVTGRQASDVQQFLVAGFARGEEVAVLSSGPNGSLRRTVTVDGSGAFGGVIGPDEQLIAAVSESGLIAVPPEIHNVLLDGQTDAVTSDTLLIAMLWGEEAAGLPTPVPEFTPTPPPECFYVVRSGDTLSRIAQRRGVSLKDLLEANPQITNPELIRTGTRLMLPGCTNAGNP